MALNPSIGYSVSPEVTKYGTSIVSKFVLSPTWTFKLVSPKNGVYVMLPHCTLKPSPFSNISFNGLPLVQDNFLLNRICLQ